MRKLVAAALLLAPLSALAQVPPRQPTTIIKFGEETVSGSKQAPDVEFVDEDGHRTKHSSLIQLRGSFAEKVLNSSKELR